MWTRAVFWGVATLNTTWAPPANTLPAAARRFISTWFQIPAISRQSIRLRLDAREPSRTATVKTARENIFLYWCTETPLSPDKESPQRPSTTPISKATPLAGRCTLLSTTCWVSQHLTTNSTRLDLPRNWNNYKGGCHKREYEVDTGVPAQELTEITERLTTYPGDFHIHPKVKKLLEQRAEMGAGKRAVDYGMAEALAFGSLVKHGIPVRLSGQDTKRGTFNQRHSVLTDVEDEKEYVPLEHIAPDQARCEIYNSTLSEAGVLGFEYGYSRDYPEPLVLWEAQYGDFANVAQASIDHFVS